MGVRRARAGWADVYPWGDTFDGDNAVYRGNADDRTWDAASRPGGVSWVGALDLSGNVWEWVADRYGPYPAERQVNPAGPASGERRVLRGGSWISFDTYDLRAANRSWHLPASEQSNPGFRCARDWQP